MNNVESWTRRIGWWTGYTVRFVRTSKSEFVVGVLVGVMLVMAGFNIYRQPVKTLVASVVFSTLAAVVMKKIKER
jgi:phosphate/sulfate permease